MLFHRNERKRSNLALYLTVGALAAIGAIGLTRKGKRCICQIGDKIRNKLSMCGICSCSQDS